LSFQQGTAKSDVKAYRDDVPPGQTKILVNGRPFWQQTRKGQHKELLDADEITDDMLPMNADVLVEVDKGNVKLKDLPTTK
jgi:hypothetical protein